MEEGDRQYIRRRINKITETKLDITAIPTKTVAAVKPEERIVERLMKLPLHSPRPPSLGRPKFML